MPREPPCPVWSSSPAHRRWGSPTTPATRSSTATFLPYDDLAAALPRITGFHLKDKIGGPGVWNFPALGSGEIDFARIRRILAAGDDERVVPLSIEIEFTSDGPDSLDDVHDSLVRSVLHLRSLGFSDTGVRA